MGKAASGNPNEETKTQEQREREEYDRAEEHVWKERAERPRVPSVLGGFSTFIGPRGGRR